MKKASRKEIFIWNILGSFCNAVSSVLFLIVVTRLTPSAESDAFSLAWSIAQLLLTVGTFQVRLYQATDVNGKYSLKQYVLFRFSTVAAMLALSVGYIMYYQYSGLKAKVILALSAYKAVEALSDVFQGWFQQKERLDLAGKSLSARVVMSLCVFTATLILRKDLLWSCISMVVASLICIVAFDLRYIRLKEMSDRTGKVEEKHWWSKLLVTCFPLFINAFLVMSIFNAPKMAIDEAISNATMKQGMQTIYNIVFMPTSVINLMYIVFRPVITNMAIEWNRNNFTEYLKLVKRILVQLAVISAIILCGGYFLGIPVLSLFYGIDLGEAKLALIILLVAGGLNTFVNVLDNALTVIRKQYFLVIAYVITWIYSVTTASWFVNKWEINGAAIAFFTSMALLLAVVLILFKFSYMEAQKEKMENIH